MNDDLRALLEELDPTARDDLRRALIHNQADRDRHREEVRWKITER